LLADRDCGVLAGRTTRGTPPEAARNPIQTESSRWDEGVDVPAAKGREIEGYASDVALLPGQALRLHVSTTPAARYQIRIYRLGWYRGKGGRLVACLQSCIRTRAGMSRPIPCRM
jgi:hypothetical protein